MTGYAGVSISVRGLGDCLLKAPERGFVLPLAKGLVEGFGRGSLQALGRRF
jgi:hypothetical protein